VRWREGRWGLIHLLGSPGQASLEDGLTSGHIGGNISLVWRSRAGGLD